MSETNIEHQIAELTCRHCGAPKSVHQAGHWCQRTTFEPSTPHPAAVAEGGGETERDWSVSSYAAGENGHGAFLYALALRPIIRLRPDRDGEILLTADQLDALYHIARLTLLGPAAHPAPAAPGEDAARLRDADPSDTVMLDWMEANAADAICWNVPVAEGEPLASNNGWTVEPRDEEERHDNPYRGRTLREALRWAMKARAARAQEGR